MTDGARGTGNFILWEPNANGHRLMYVRLLFEEIRRRQARGRLATTRAVVDDHQFKLHLADTVKPSEILVVGTLAQALEEASRTNSTLIVPEGDNKILPLLRSRTSQDIAILVMSNPRWQPRGLLRPRQLLKELSTSCLSLRSNFRVYRLSPNGPLDQIQKNCVPDPVILAEGVEEIVTRRRAARAERQMSDDRIWVGVVGGISLHKNPLLVSEAIRIAQERSGRAFGFCLFGVAGSDAVDAIEASIRAASEGGLQVARLLQRRSNGELNLDILSLDVLVCAYSTHAPNSTTAKAHYLGTRVVGAGSEQFLTNGKQFWSATAKGLDRGQLADAILRSLEITPPEPCAPPPAREFASRLLGFE